jgi:hypothetical protein
MPRRHIAGLEVELHVFLTSALVGCEWSSSCTGRFSPSKRPSGIHWIGTWMILRNGLNSVAKRKNPYPCQESNPGRLARIVATIRTELPRHRVCVFVCVYRHYRFFFSNILFLSCTQWHYCTDLVIDITLIMRFLVSLI